MSDVNNKSHAKATSAKVSEENQGALGIGARGQDRLTESSGSLNDAQMKREFALWTDIM